MSVSTYVPDSTKILHIAYADFVSRQIGRTVHVVQYDDSLPLLAVKLFSDGQPYTIPSNANISIKLGKSDGKFVYNPALGCDSTRHIAYFEITYQMVVLAETVSPVIEVRIGSSIAASSSIGIIIDRNPIQRDDIESTSEWKVIQEAVDYSKEAISAAASASASRSAAATSEQNALSYRNAAQTAANSASNSASSASMSATNAVSSANSASNSASSAFTSATNAVSSANSASNSASSAFTSATNAKISEDNAKDSETKAKSSETNAANSELEARRQANASELYSTISRSYAVGDTDYREGEKTDNAKYYSEKSEESMLSSKSSEHNADISSLLAKSYAIGEGLTTLGDGEYEIVTSDGFAFELFGREGEEIDNAKYYSEQARIQKEAGDKNTKISRSYAVGDTHYREGEETDNAKYYYEQTKNISLGLSGAFIPMGTITFADIQNQTKVAGYTYNISDDFVSDDTFKDGSGIKYPHGTNVYYTADGYWDCLAGSLLSGIKGDAETDFRQGYVNITPDNIGSYNKDTVDNMISGLNNIINMLIDRVTELEDLSGFAHLVVDDSGSELVTSDNHTIILSI